MNRRNFFKDALTGAAALLMPSVLLQEEKKPIALPDVGNSECRLKNVALYYEEGKYVGSYDFELPPRSRQIEDGKAIARVSSSWEARINEIPKPNLFRLNYLNKTC